MRVRPDEAFNISMTLLDGGLQESGIWGLRVEFWDDLSSSYAPESSLFFYDIKENLTVCCSASCLKCFTCLWKSSCRSGALVHHLYLSWSTRAAHVKGDTVCVMDARCLSICLRVLHLHGVGHVKKL